MGAELAVVLHGVQPATWRACQRVIDAIGDVAALPLTLALAPGAMKDEGNTAFIDEMQERLECGDDGAERDEGGQWG